MKRRIKSLILLILIIIIISSLCVSSFADNTGVFFTSVNDTLLDLSASPVFYGSSAYVSARVFANFGIYYSYFASDMTAELYNDSKQIFFDMEKANAYDSNLTPYDASAIYRNGVTYVPVSWTCRYFGLSYSLISGKGSGDILRIKNGAEVLSDNQFLDAASSLMQSRYNEYYHISGESDTVPETVKPDRNHTIITLSFIGLPSDKILDYFDNYSVSACFFLDADDADADPDIVRRIVCSGHKLGIYSTGTASESINDASNAIYSASQVLPTVVTAPPLSEESCANYAKLNAMAYYSPHYKTGTGKISLSDLTSIISSAEHYLSLCFNINQESVKILPHVLQYLTSNEYTVVTIRETML